jgi:hypothetical protein
MARMAAISQYFATSTPNPAEGILPLRIILAKHLVERNYGRVLVEDAEEEKTVVRIEFPAQG